eukprot:COSAG02_NODE_24881_length_675_cov_0.894097_2_plen_65_part_01
MQMLIRIQRSRRKKIPDDNVARRVLELLLENFKYCEWPRSLVAGGWSVLCNILHLRSALGPVALK